MEIIRHFERHETISYVLFFPVYGPGWGFSFDCTEQGVVDVAALNPVAQQSYKTATESGVTPEVQKCYHRWTEPTVGRCTCGAEVELDGFTNTCICGRDYNMSGQLLASREQWGEETGESLSDILSIP